MEPDLEDVHMNIEARLTERIGARRRNCTPGARNDQVATDLRLTCATASTPCAPNSRGCKSLLQVAEREAETVMPGFTHLQIAQPVTFGHHLMAWFEMLARDDARPRDCRSRVNAAAWRCRARRHQLPHRPRPHREAARFLAAVAENSSTPCPTATSPSNRRLRGADH